MGYFPFSLCVPSKIFCGADTAIVVVFAFDYNVWPPGQSYLGCLYSSYAYMLLPACLLVLGLFVPFGCLLIFFFRSAVFLWCAA